MTIIASKREKESNKERASSSRRLVITITYSKNRKKNKIKEGEKKGMVCQQLASRAKGNSLRLGA
jgi:hypothetical protein